MSNASLRGEAGLNLLEYLGDVAQHFDDPTVNEIMINGPGNVFIEDHNGMRRLDSNISEKQIEAAIRAIMTKNNKPAGLIMDARLKGLRVACALPPVTVHGPLISIRKHATRSYTLADYAASGSFDVLDDVTARAYAGTTSDSETLKIETALASGGENITKFFEWAIPAHKTLMIVGGTGSGKTTFAKTILSLIPATERIATCEDTNELTLSQPNIVQLESQAQHGISIRDLIKLCLRLRPDRIVVGEVRGAEAYDLIDSMNTGHPGSIFTLHADSAELGLDRLFTLAGMNESCANSSEASVRRNIAQAIDYVVFLSRRANKRGPEQIVKVDKELRQLEDGSYRFDTKRLFDRFKYA